MRSALNGEAEHYWTLFKADPNQPLPNTDNLVGYMAVAGDLSSLPEAVYKIGVEPGYHRGEFSSHHHIVHVSDFEENRLYLVFDNESVSDLALFFGIVPLFVVLLLVYGLMLFAYRMSQRAISPIVRLANYLDEFEFGVENSELELGPLRNQTDTEAATMIEALDHFTERVNAFVERERMFTRDASHELRTPVAVFKASLDLLEKNQSLSGTDSKAMLRMRRTVNDMEGLIETLLLLASEQMPPNESVAVEEVVERQIEQLTPLAQTAGNQMSFRCESKLLVHAPTRVVQILVTNLLKNANTYTQKGDIEVVLDDSRLMVADTGVGMSAQELKHAFEPFYRGPVARDSSRGHGLGLSIVKRLIAQYNWHIEVESEPGEGTKISIIF